MSVPTTGSPLIAEWQKRRKALQQLASGSTAAPTPTANAPIKADQTPLPNTSLATAASAQAPTAPSAPAAPGVAQASISQVATPPATPSLTPQPTPSSWQGSGATPDPRDAQYWADVAKLGHERDVGAAQTDLQQTQADVARRRALEDLSLGHAQNERAAKQQAAAQGRFYGSRLGETLSDEQQSYLRGQFRTDEDYNAAVSALDVQRYALEHGYSVDEAAALAAASYRWAQNEMSKAQLAAMTAANQPPPPEAAPAPAAGPYVPPGWTPQQAQGGAGPPGPHYVWSPQQSRWVYTGPSPGNNYYWTGVAWKKK
jgi:hypothetical protein